MPIRPLLLAQLVFFSNGLTAQTNFQADWTSSLGSYAPQGVYRLTVCPSGRSFFTDSFGRLTAISRWGTIEIDQTSLPELQQTVVFSCDSSNRLHAVNSKEWTMWEIVSQANLPRLIKAQATDISRLSLVPRQLAFALSGDAFLLAIEAKASRQTKIFHFRQDLTVGKSNLISDTQDPAIRQLFSRGQLVGLPTGHLALFTRHGRLPTFFNSDLSPTGSLNLNPDGLEVLSATALPNGDLFVQTIEPNQLPKPKSRFMLTRIKPASPADAQPQPLPPGVKGILQGADANGKLYFLSVSPRTGANIYRYTLNP